MAGQRKPRSNPAALRGLLDLSPSAAGHWREDELSAILQHQLAAPLAVDLAMPFLHPCSIETFGQLLNHPSPPIETLRKVKEFAKSARTDPDAPLPPQIATVLYFAAIVVARLRHGQRITELDDASLAPSLAWCAQQPWLDPSTRRIFDEAQRKL